MSVDESQDCNWVARECVRSLYFVVFSYVSKAALKMGTKLEGGRESDDVVAAV